MAADKKMVDMEVDKVAKKVANKVAEKKIRH